MVFGIARGMEKDAWSAACVSRFARTGAAFRWSSREGHMVDALASGGDEGRRSLRYAPGSWQASDEPEMPEWGNPTAFIGGHRFGGANAGN